MRLLTLALLLPAVASAQSINIDTGSGLVPGAAYGGAAGQAGVWNPISASTILGTNALVDIDGNATPATVQNAVLAGSGSSFCFETPDGDDAALMEDGLLIQDVVGQDSRIELEFDGLELGWYQVYTYCWNPCDSTSAVIGITGSPDFRSQCGDLQWPDSQRYRRTFVRHRAQVTDGSLRLIVQSRQVDPLQATANINGIQLVFHGSELILGDTYCWLATPNSSGQSATLDLVGDVAALSDNVEFRARALPAFAPTIILAAPEEARLPAVAGLGTLCLGGSISVLGSVLDSGPAGTIFFHQAISQPDSNPMIGIAAGETWHFQVWYRDPGDGWSANLSDAVRVTFE